MACDPRKRAGAQQEKSEFFRTLGKIGDIEALNSVDSNIGQGLRALETISNQLRIGGAVPSVWSDEETSVEAGADAVYEAVDIDPNTAKEVGTRFNPGVLNRAQGQAEAIYERVRQGNFEIRDVPEAIQDFRNLSQLVGGIFTPRREVSESDIQRSKICDPSPWAIDLINLAPKHKFMFVVEFHFTEDYVSAFSDLEFAFVIKRSTRPNISFEYEDINYYNFRTKVLKRSEYQPMQMTFYDDMLDNALRFYNRYLQIISPISRSVGDGTSTLFEESGMTFDQSGGPNSSSINAVGNTTKTIIDYINVYHLIHGGRQVDIYRFDNPRLQTMQLDDLDMTDTGAGTEVTIEFNYDGLLIQPSFDVRDFRDNITAATDAGTYAITFENVSADDPTTTKDIDKDPFTPTGIAREAVSLTPEEIERFAAQGNNAPGT
jgi:hypothetical protein